MHRDTRRAALTISEFARRTGLSHKALRLYDLSGLLPPAGVDPANGYRLYAPEQIERAKLISLLRRLDMPLATVAEVLAHVQAYTTVTKRECLYPRILHAYDAVTRFVRDSELSPFGPAREIYFTCLDDVGDDDPFAYVAQPIERIRPC